MPDQKCRTCRYWSEWVAEWMADEPEMQALCLNSNCPQEMVPASHSCPHWADGSVHGGIDLGPDYHNHAYDEEL